jgi:hypothetical protein
MGARLCEMSSCTRPATVGYGGGEPRVCEKHARDLDLSWETEDHEFAREYLAGFALIAKASGVRALQELVELASAEGELRLAAMEAERRVIRDD